jgi:hypothetical protein
MSRVYEICGDESWVNTDPPLNRYWCFFGGILSSKQEADILEEELQKCLDKHNHTEEIKWNNLYHLNLHVYTELVDILLDHIVKREIRFRSVFLDRTYVHLPAVGNKPKSNLDIQFHICYQFLKKAFGLEYLPPAENGIDKILIRLDTHSSQKHKSNLKRYVEKIPSYLGRPDLAVEITHVGSHWFNRIGVCDVMIGAAGFMGNRHQNRRQDRQRGMTQRQRYKIDFAKSIYNRLRKLAKELHGKDAFSWFESTSNEGLDSNRFNQKIRFWKFKPKSHTIDENWQNKKRHWDGTRHIDTPF